MCDLITGLTVSHWLFCFEIWESDNYAKVSTIHFTRTTVPTDADGLCSPAYLSTVWHLSCWGVDFNPNRTIFPSRVGKIPCCSGSQFFLQF